MNSKIQKISIIIFSILVFTILMLTPGCEKHNIKWNLDRVNPNDSANITVIPVGTPTVNTTNISNITQISAIVSGEIISLGNSSISQHGHCWSTSSNPTTSNSKTSLGATSNTGNFSSNLSGLSSNTTYYVRAYATNSVGIAYGNQVSFTAGQNTYAPIVTTGSINNVTTNSASAPGTITDLGNSSISQHGHCWSTSSNPTTSNSKTSLGATSNTGNFSSNLSGLSSNTTYYVRAYATNSIGIAYGNQVSFFTSTNTSIPTVASTYSASSITTNSAQSGGNVTSDGNSTVTAKGVCWSTSSNPTTANNKTNDGSGVGSFTSSITGLSSNTSYYVRAYATNSIGTAYGNQVNFTTNFQNVTCNITSSTTGTDYTVMSPTQSVFISGDSYTITLYSPTYAFNQASSVELYLDENQVYSFGTWLVFSNNTRTFTLPTVVTASNCYTLRVFYFGDIYISTPFTIY